MVDNETEPNTSSTTAVDYETNPHTASYSPSMTANVEINTACNQISSQDTESTISLSSPSLYSFSDCEQTVHATTTCVEKEIQTDQCICISPSEYEELLEQASKYVDVEQELEKISSHFFKSSNPCPEMDPGKFEEVCQQIGAEKLFNKLYNAMSLSRMSAERKHLTKLRTMVVIYIMMFSQSQKANWFQVTLARTLQQFGISDHGLASLRNLGVATHPRTVKMASEASAASHLGNVATFFQEVVDNEQFLVICIDDFHNIHTQHRPETKSQTEATHMSTLLVKVFPNVKAISNEHHESPLLPPSPVQCDSLFKLVNKEIASLSQSYSTTNPDWVLAKYFDPEEERHRLLLHDYQQTEIQEMRSMDNTKLIDSLHLPLKSLDDLLTAFKHMLDNGLKIYLNNFLAPFMGDWPTQFFMRQLVYNSAKVSLPAIVQNVVPMIGPLHISLNSRECVVKYFHPIFAELYSFLFGKKAKLAKKPKPWRVSLLLEVLYGGWTLIRENIISIFCHCKEVEFLTLINLVDNYVPLVLSIYSVIFKCNDYQLYCKSLLRCWIMCMVFRRRHYDKALLVVLSAFMYWQETNHPMFHTLSNALVAFDEYPIENFHSVLRARTNSTDNADQVSRKAKEIDVCKHEMHMFKSNFVPPRKLDFSRKSISKLKVKAAEFLTKKFELLHNNPSQAVLIPRVRGQRKDITKWKLPNLFGNKIVTSKVLPLGFSSVESPPNPQT